MRSIAIRRCRLTPCLGLEISREKRSLETCGRDSKVSDGSSGVGVDVDADDVERPVGSQADQDRRDDAAL